MLVFMKGSPALLQGTLSAGRAPAELRSRELVGVTVGHHSVRNSVETDKERNNIENPEELFPPFWVLKDSVHF